jgi:uncharacterized protein (DUF1501 family)
MLRGAVDGLNVVAPVGDGQYYSLRPNIALSKPGVQGGSINLDGHFALNPALSPLMDMWNNKQLSFIHSCGSPDPSRSHFDAQDYMESGEPGIKSVSTGWLNRLLAQLPTNDSPVRAINFGPTMPRIFAGAGSVANVALTKNNPLPTDRREIANYFGQLYSKDPMLAPVFAEGIAARETINKDLAEENQEDQMEQMAANKGARAPQADFGKQLARLLVKEPKTQVAFIAFGGWDTHVNQGADKGQLANKLTPLGLGLADLYNKLGDEGDNVTTIVMSEFGRTAKENGNKGTDHGHGNVMWVLGGNIAGGKVFGRWNGLSGNALYEGRDVAVTTDFRSVIAAVLAGHLSIKDNALATVFPHFSPDRSLENILNA